MNGLFILSTKYTSKNPSVRDASGAILYPPPYVLPLHIVSIVHLPFLLLLSISTSNFLYLNLKNVYTIEAVYI